MAKKKNVNGWPTSLEEACKVLKRKPILPVVKGLPAKHAKHVIAGYILITVTEAINSLIPEPAGVFPDFNNSDQWKWEAWWKGIKATKKKPGGVGFSRTDYDYSLTYSVLGSRFCFKTKEGAEFVHESGYFDALLIDYYLIPD